MTGLGMFSFFFTSQSVFFGAWHMSYMSTPYFCHCTFLYLVPKGHPQLTNGWPSKSSFANQLLGSQSIHSQRNNTVLWIMLRVPKSGNKNLSDSHCIDAKTPKLKTLFHIASMGKQTGNSNSSCLTDNENAGHEVFSTLWCLPCYESRAVAFSNQREGEG